MIYNFKYSDTLDRTEVIRYLQEKKYARVIDIGASASSWSTPYITHYADILEHSNSSLHAFTGSICSYHTWKQILDDVQANGKFDFVICTHTLEDISSPQLVCDLLPLIANEGYVAVPSKYKELVKHEGPYFGWIHHRWIFNKEGNDFVAYPKLALTEYINIPSLLKGNENSNSTDLSFFWKDNFVLNIANNDYMGPDVESVVRYFYALGND